MRKGFVVVFACLLTAGKGLAEGDGSPGPSPDPVLRAEIERLAEDLDHAEFRRREEADQRLEEIGEKAAWALVPLAEKGSLEARERASRLLERIGWAPPSERAGIDRLVGILKTTRDLRVAANTLRELETGGRPARKVLEDLFPENPSPRDDVSLSVRADRTTVTRGSPVTLKVTFVNNGKEPIWLNPGFFRCGWRVEGNAWVPPDHTVMGDAIVKALRGMALGQDGRRELLYLAPGGTYQGEVAAGDEFRRIGACVVEGKYVSTDRSILDSEEVSERVSATPVAVEADGIRVHVLPPLDPKPAGVSAGIILDKARVKAGAPLVFDFVLTCTGPQAVRLEISRDGKPGNRFWAALIREDGEVVAMETFGEDGADRNKVECLKKGQTTTVRWISHLRAPPGRYQLVAGYAVPELPRRTNALFDGRPGAPAFWEGEAVSRRLSVTVE